MAKWGNCDYKQLQQLRENIAHLQGIDMDKFCKERTCPKSWPGNSCNL